MDHESMPHVQLEFEPDLHPLYPSPSRVAPLVSSHSGLSPAQKATLISHCLTRACVFGELGLLQYIIHDPNCRPFVDLNAQDDDGLVLISSAILGFGSESDRDVEREECIRLLITEGSDPNTPDNAGWTPLHHAALLAPPTLISYLLTHGCSPLTLTRRNLTALDIVTAHTVIPGREDVALFLEEAMRSVGWQSSKMAQQRRDQERRALMNGNEKSFKMDISRSLDLNPHWWPSEESNLSQPDSSDGEEDVADSVYTPALDYTSMLVFSPESLPAILDVIITDFQPSARNSEPANVLYMLARFACLQCDQTWLEDLIIGATDAIEEAFFSHCEDVTCLVFWLYNCTTWLHLMRCDAAINEACEVLGSFDLIEEVINSVYVFLLRFAERRIDQLLDAALLDHSPLSSEFESVQFESDWSLFRSPFSSKKKTAPRAMTPSSTSGSLKSTAPPSPGRIPSRPPSPSPSQLATSPPSSKGFSSLRQTLTRTRSPSTPNPLQTMFGETPTPSPKDITSFLVAFHSLLTASGINPAITVQLWSQVMYWTSCEMFNRIINRKRYLCRSRAVQISMNLGVLEEWVGQMGLPRGVESHFAPVRELLHWLQCSSSMDDFSDLVATIQTMRYLNPLQMRRAVRDYKYEVNEPRMSEDCGQYLAQLQKDWERQRVKLGVEALRKEMNDREREFDDDSSSTAADTSGVSSSPSAPISDDIAGAQAGIDSLFDRGFDKSQWIPPHPPEALGELLDSRYMLPLIFPSDPKMLASIPDGIPSQEKMKRRSLQLDSSQRRSTSRTSFMGRGSMAWRSNTKQLRDINLDLLHSIDAAIPGHGSIRIHAKDEDLENDEGNDISDVLVSVDDGRENGNADVMHLTSLVKKSSIRARHSRNSTGEETVSA